MHAIRRLSCHAAVLLLGAMPCAARTAEPAASAATASAPVAASAASSASDRPVHRPVEAGVLKGPQDPMEMLRERLAQKLGVVKTPDPSNPNLLRVEGKSTEPAARPGESVAPGQAAARRKVAHATAPADRPAAHPAPPAHPADWDYAGAGNPAAWAQLNPEFAACANGHRQSPIDIRDGIKVVLDPVQFSYQPSAFRVIDNGHTVQVNVAPGNFIEVTGRRFELLQFHFHRPSEERIDGKQFDMVVHLVHQDAAGRLAVVAVLLQSGSAQAIVQSVWNNLPLEKGEEVAARGTLDLAQLLPVERGYYTYMGSLTTPPCSEGVLWMVMKQPVPISPEQIGIFARLYPMNARPVQPASERLIKESN